MSSHDKCHVMKRDGNVIKFDIMTFTKLVDVLSLSF